MENEKIEATKTMNLWWFIKETIHRKFKQEPIAGFFMVADKGTINVDIKGESFKITVEKV